MEGIFIDDELRVLLFDRGYLTGLRGFGVFARIYSGLGRVVIKRFYTNVIFYALIHGEISDYSKYSPAEYDEMDIELPDELPEHLRELNITPKQR